MKFPVLNKHFREDLKAFLKSFFIQCINKYWLVYVQLDQSELPMLYPFNLIRHQILKSHQYFIGEYFIRCKDTPPCSPLLSSLPTLSHYSLFAFCQWFFIPCGIYCVSLNTMHMLMKTFLSIFFDFHIIHYIWYVIGLHASSFNRRTQAPSEIRLCGAMFGSGIVLSPVTYVM